MRTKPAALDVRIRFTDPAAPRARQAARSSPWQLPRESANCSAFRRERAAELAAAVGRGARSGVGSHGFVSGGLIFERGRTRWRPVVGTHRTH